MTEWLNQNLLAVYGAIVGTLALVLNLSGLLHDVRKGAVRLRVQCRPHQDLKSSLTAHAATKTDDAADRRTFFEAYVVTVFNDGAVPAHLADAGVVCADHHVEQALVSQPLGSHLILRSVADARLEPIAPKSSETFTVYLRAGNDVFTPKRALVIDQTGKKWYGRVRS